MKRKRGSATEVSRREFLKWGILGSVATGIAPGLLWTGCGNRGRSRRPNVILITVDTLRADHLGCYGYPFPTSPRIDQFASEACLFENCLSHAPVTSSSLASLLSGFLPHETRVFRNLPLPKQVRILPEILSPEGYTTVGIVSNYVLRKKRGWFEKFDVYDDSMNSVESIRPTPERIAADTTDKAIELLRRFSEEPLFLWVHYQDPHGPYTPPESYGELFTGTAGEGRILEGNSSVSGYGGIPSYQMLGEHREFDHYVSRYDGEIRYLDDHLARLFSELVQLGLYDDSLIVFTADHGEGMGENDYFFAHGENLGKGLTHVPLIIKVPNSSPGRKTEFVQHLDVVPTILKSLEIEADPRFRGLDLLDPDSGTREIFAELELPKKWARDPIMFSIVVDGMKLVSRPTRPDKEKNQLFNLRTDPREEKDLINDPAFRGRVEDMSARLIRISNEDRLALDIVNAPVSLTDEEVKNLKALGYINN